MEISKLFSLNSKKNVKLLFKKKILNKKTDKNQFFDAGQFYWAKAKIWMTEKSVFSSKSSIIEIDRTKAQDINNIEDWKFAEFLFRLNNN